MFSRRLPLLLLGCSLLSFLATGCLDSDKLSVVEYNNAVVGTLNDTSSAIEGSTVTYDEEIPNIVTESSAIDATAVEGTYIEALTKTDAAEQVLTLLSANEAQQAEVQTKFTPYLELARTYLHTYNDMVNYYKNGDYKESLDNVATFDQDLHNQYNEFIKANNELVDILAGFVK
jgi:hypothetical protein